MHKSMHCKFHCKLKWPILKIKLSGINWKIQNFAWYWMLEKDRASATRPLRHSCHLSQDKNRTKQNHESGKCRLLHVFQVFVSRPCPAHLHPSEDTTADLQVERLFSARPSLRSTDRSCPLVDQGHGKNHQPTVSLFFSTAITNRQ